MNKLSLLREFVVCPACKSGVDIAEMGIECTKCGKQFSIIDGDIPSMFDKTTQDVELSKARWEEIYLSDFFMEEAEKEFREFFLNDTIAQLLECVSEDFQHKKRYLELGCGQGFVGEELARNAWLFIGVDFSLNALLSVKKRLNNRGIGNYLLIHADIQSLPIRERSIDLVYGGGVIEHLRNTQAVLNQIFGILSHGGVSFNTVPCLNLANVLYRSLSGGIPNVPILRQLAELVHLKMLQGRHMTFGYELQFSVPQLIKLHRNAGFKPSDIIVDRFDCHVQLHRVRNRYLKRFFRYLSKNVRQFWPMLKVTGIKR